MIGFYVVLNPATVSNNFIKLADKYKQSVVQRVLLVLMGVGRRRYSVINYSGLY
jgi:hypothetical protein